MSKYLYRGQVIHVDGRRVDVLLKEGVKHWIDNDRVRWRKEDGTRSRTDINVRWPRLILTSIHTVAGKLPNNDRPATHEGRVAVSAIGGPGKATPLRETKAYWIDPMGNKYGKVDGWSVPNDGTRLRLSTLQVIVKKNRVKQPTKR
jgi:hypothetical protein